MAEKNQTTVEKEGENVTDLKSALKLLRGPAVPRQTTVTSWLRLLASDKGDWKICVSKFNLARNTKRPVERVRHPVNEQIALQLRAQNFVSPYPLPTLIAYQINAKGEAHLESLPSSKK